MTVRAPCPGTPSPGTPSPVVVHLSFRDGRPLIWAEGWRAGAGELWHRVADWLPRAAPCEGQGFWLPAAGARPLPSPAAARLGLVRAARGPVALRRFELPALQVDLTALLVVRPAAPDRAWGAEWPAWDALVELARALWSRGAVFPVLEPVTGGYRAGWRASLVDADLASDFDRWASAVPRVLLAAEEPAPNGARRGGWRRLLDRTVDALAEAASIPADARVRRWDSLDEAAGDLLSALAVRPRPVIARTRPAGSLRRHLAAWSRPLDRSEAPPYGLTARLDLRAGEPPACLVFSVAPADLGRGVAWRDAVLGGYVPPDAFAVQLAGPGPVLRRLASLGPVDRLELNGEELASFLTEEAGRLHRQGVRVLLPRELVRDPGTLRLRACLGPARGGLGLEALHDVDWDVVLAGVRLSAADLLRLARRQRPLIELHGRYVLVSTRELSQAARLIRRSASTGLPLGTLLRHALARPGAGPALELDLGEELSRLLAPAFGGPAAPPPLEPPRGLRATLRPYQQTGFRWLAALAGRGLGALLADEMGLGKTVQVLALLLHRRSLGAGPSLVVAPTSVLTGWRTELDRFAPDLRAVVYHGPGRRLADAGCDVVLTSYGVLARDQDALANRRWDLVVLDEAQAVKNPGADVSRAARRLQAAARVALTGTPVENRLADLWSLFAFLNPGYLGSLRSFRQTFATPVEERRDSARASELRARLAPFLLRRVKADPGIAPELPPRVEKTEYVTASAEQVALYRATLDWLARRLADGDPSQRRSLVLATLSRLKTILDHPGLLFKTDARLDAAPSGKCRRLIRLLEDALAGGDKVLVYTQFASFARRLAPLCEERLAVPVALLWGGQRRAERDAAIAAFRRVRGPAVFVLSLRAGGVGLNLPEAGRVIHVDRWWNPAVEDQATGRAHRLGQQRVVVVHTMVTAGTIEERIHRMLEDKRRIAAEVVRGEAEWLVAMDDRALLDTLAVEGEAR